MYGVRCLFHPIRGAVYGIMNGWQIDGWAMTCLLLSSNNGGIKAECVLCRRMDTWALKGLESEMWFVIIVMMNSFALLIYVGRQSAICTVGTPPLKNIFLRCKTSYPQDIHSPSHHCPLHHRPVADLAQTPCSDIFCLYRRPCPHSRRPGEC